jgi:hypothetical protein
MEKADVYRSTDALDDTSLEVRDKHPRFMAMLDEYLDAMRAGAISEAQAAAWAKSMLARSEQGTFFGASNFYSYVARPA